MTEMGFYSCLIWTRYLQLKSKIVSADANQNWYDMTLNFACLYSTDWYWIETNFMQSWVWYRRPPLISLYDLSSKLAENLHFNALWGTATDMLKVLKIAEFPVKFIYCEKAQNTIWTLSKLCKISQFVSHFL